MHVDNPMLKPASLTQLAAQQASLARNNSSNNTGSQAGSITTFNDSRGVTTSTTATPAALTQARSLTELVRAQETGGGLLRPESLTELAGGTPRRTDTLAPDAKLSDTEIKAIADDAANFRDVASQIEPLFDGMAQKIVDGLLESRDADGDGLLSNHELQISAERFASIDGDRDGLVTRDELTESLRNDLGRALKNDPAVDPAQFAKEWFAALDLDRSGSLTSAEAPLPESVTAAADTDADGELSLTEVTEEVKARTPAIDARSRLEEIADVIGRRLDEAGFTHQPPTNVRDLVESLRLDQSSSTTLMQMLSARYPQGLGISLLG